MEIPFRISAPNSLADPPPIFGLFLCLIDGQLVLLRPDSSVGKFYFDLNFFLEQIDLVHHYAEYQLF